MRRYVNANDLVKSKKHKHYDEDLIEFETMNFLFQPSLFPENEISYTSKYIEEEAIKVYKRDLLSVR